MSRQVSIAANVCRALPCFEPKHGPATAKPISPNQMANRGPAPAFAAIVPAAGPVVVTVTKAVFPATMELGVIEHAGASVGVGWTEHDRAIEPLNPPVAIALTEELDVAPGFTVPGVRAEAESRKPGDAIVNTVP